MFEKRIIEAGHASALLGILLSHRYFAVLRTIFGPAALGKIMYNENMISSRDIILYRSSSPVFSFQNYGIVKKLFDVKGEVV